MFVLILSVWKHKPASHSMSNYITHTHTRTCARSTQTKFTHFDRFRRSKPCFISKEKRVWPCWRPLDGAARARARDEKRDVVNKHSVDLARARTYTQTHVRHREQQTSGGRSQVSPSLYSCGQYWPRRRCRGLSLGFVPPLFYFSLFFSLSDNSDGLCTRITWCLALVNLCACTVGDLSHDNTVLAVKTHNVLSTCIHSYNCAKTQCWSCDELRTELLMSTTNGHTTNTWPARCFQEDRKVEGERQLFSAKYSWFPDHHHPTLCNILFGTVRSRPKWPFTGQCCLNPLSSCITSVHTTAKATRLFTFIFLLCESEKEQKNTYAPQELPLKHWAWTWL